MKSKISGAFGAKKSMAPTANKPLSTAKPSVSSRPTTATSKASEEKKIDGSASRAKEDLKTSLNKSYGLKRPGTASTLNKIAQIKSESSTP